MTTTTMMTITTTSSRSTVVGRCSVAGRSRVRGRVVAGLKLVLVGRSRPYPLKRSDRCEGDCKRHQCIPDHGVSMNTIEWTHQVSLSRDLRLHPYEAQWGRGSMLLRWIKTKSEPQTSNGAVIMQSLNWCHERHLVAPVDTETNQDGGTGQKGSCGHGVPPSRHMQKRPRGNRRPR